MGRGKKRKQQEDNEREFDPAPKHLSIAHVKNQEKRLIIILEQAQLESVKVRRNFKLLCLNQAFLNFSHYTNMLPTIF